MLFFFFFVSPANNFVTAQADALCHPLCWVIARWEPIRFRAAQWDKNIHCWFQHWFWISARLFLQCVWQSLQFVIKESRASEKGSKSFFHSSLPCCSCWEEAMGHPGFQLSDQDGTCAHVPDSLTPPGSAESAGWHLSAQAFSFPISARTVTA